MPLSEIDSRDFWGNNRALSTNAWSCPNASDRYADQAAKPTDKVYKIYDAEGLYGEVPPTGSKRWRFKYRMNGKEKRISLGIYRDWFKGCAGKNVMKPEGSCGRPGPRVIKNKTAYAEKTFQHSRRMGCASSGNMGSRHGNGRAKAEKLHLSGTWQCPLRHYPIEVLSVIKAVIEKGELWRRPARTLAFARRFSIWSRFGTYPQ